MTLPRVEMEGFVMQAVRTATNAQSSGDCGRIMIVLLTDGRANVSLGKSNEDPDAIAEGAPKPTQELLKTEVLDMAKRCGSGGFNLLVIDTENKVRLLTHSHNMRCPDACSLEEMLRSAPKHCQDLLKTESLDMAKRCKSNRFNLLDLNTENLMCPLMPV